MSRSSNNWQPAAASSAVCFLAGTAALWAGGVRSFEAVGFAVVVYLVGLAFFLNAVGVLDLKLRR